MHRDDELVEVYRHWLEADPKSRDAVLGLAQALRQAGKYEEAVKALEQANEALPASPSLQYALGMAYLKNKQTERGLDLIKRSMPSEKKTRTLNRVA